MENKESTVTGEGNAPRVTKQDHAPLHPFTIKIGTHDGALVDENGFYLTRKTMEEVVRRYNAFPYLQAREEKYFALALKQ